MKVVVSSNGPDVSSAVSPIFGRCPYFVLVDSETMDASSMPNPAIGASGGAGVQSSQMLIREGVQAVIGANVGPNAMQVFAAAGMPVYQVTGGTVQEAVDALRAGTLQLLSGPTVSTDYGKGAGNAAGGRGTGGGRGMGGGRGLGGGGRTAGG
jgi:predicted Fe-Mo cluster-binding NifX family protein